MKTIGLTGRSGSGKSSISNYLVRKGYTVCDADQTARQILLPGSDCLPLLQAEFGMDILNQDGSLKRHLLANRAFKTSYGTKRLTEITHPAIYNQIIRERDKSKQNGEKLFFIDGAVIIGTEIQKYCDVIVLVYASFELSVQRICVRDSIEPEMAKRRLNAQTPLAELQDSADYLVCNDGTLEQAQRQMDRILQLLLE